MVKWYKRVLFTWITIRCWPVSPSFAVKRIKFHPCFQR
ncbi:Uncharacterised protein [Vibrio cholerae]|nr:Uncharacterised protein [Vibrio cholerae]